MWRGAEILRLFDGPGLRQSPTTQVKHGKTLPTRLNERLCLYSCAAQATSTELRPTDSVSEEVFDADAETKNELFRSEHSAFVRLVEQLPHTRREALEHRHRVAEQAEAKYERIEMPQHLDTRAQSIAYDALYSRPKVAALTSNGNIRLAAWRSG